MFSKISVIEYDMINFYRKNYTNWNNERVKEKYFAPTEEVLSTWAKNKKNLFDIFDRHLILSKEIEYTKSIEELQLNVYNKINTNESFRAFINMLNESMDCNWDDPVLSLFANQAITKNSVLFDCVVKLSDNKTVKIQKGTKLTKVYRMIAESYNISGFEEFRIRQSQLLNQKKLKGNLHLSIHPLDYMTMSDNECGWSSCMSWENNGEFRQGTVEMMNSPMVVVGYLSSKDDMSIGNNFWNSKKWRCLFICDPETGIVSSIKSYPYFNETLTLDCVNWLKSLMTNFNYGENEIESFTTASYFSPEEDIEIDFSTNVMYNDFPYTLSYIIYPKEISQDIELNYSGPAQCMACGKVFSEEEAEKIPSSTIVCGACLEKKKCDFCGDYAYYDTIIEGKIVCSNCADGLGRLDLLTGNNIMCKNTVSVYFTNLNPFCEFYFVPTHKNNVAFFKKYFEIKKVVGETIYIDAQKEHTPIGDSFIKALRGTYFNLRTWRMKHEELLNEIKTCD